MGMQAISQNPLYHHHHHHHHHEYIQRHLLRTYWRHLDDNVSVVGRVGNKLVTSTGKLRGNVCTCVGVSGGNTVSFKITNTFDAHSPHPKSKKGPDFGHSYHFMSLDGMISFFLFNKDNKIVYCLFVAVGHCP